MRKSTRSKSQSKNSKAKKNSNEISEPDANIEEDKAESKVTAEDVPIKNNIPEEKTPKPQKGNSRIPSRTNSKTIFKISDNQNSGKSSIYFNFGTGKKFLSVNDPKKEFTESVFTIKSTLQNKIDTNKPLSRTSSENNNNEEENSSILLEIDGKTGEENEERLFDSPATLYRVISQSNSNDSKDNETTTNTRQLQFSFTPGSRPLSPFAPPTPRTTSISTGAKFKTNTSSKDTKKFTPSGRSSSTPSSKLAEVGTGNLHLNKGDGIYRLIMRRAQIGKVCLNMRVFKDMKPKSHSRTSVRFIGLNNNPTNQGGSNDSSSEPKFEIYLLKFSNEEAKAEFLSKLNEAIDDIEKK